MKVDKSHLGQKEIMAHMISGKRLSEVWTNKNGKFYVLLKL